jgi:hypothetical protein
MAQVRDISNIPSIFIAEKNIDMIIFHSSSSM